MLGKEMLLSQSASKAKLTIRFKSTSGLGSVFSLTICRPSGRWETIEQEINTTLVIPMSDIGEDVKGPSSICTYGEGPVRAFLSEMINISETYSSGGTRPVAFYIINDRSKDAYCEFWTF